MFNNKSIMRNTLLGAAFSTACLPGIANDSSVGDDNGTIVFKRQADISMDKETLSISENRVDVDYVFTNNGKTDVMTTIAFPMPPMYFGYSDHSEIKDFKLLVDGVGIKTNRKLVVLLKDKTDITKKIAALGWSERDLVTLLETQELPKGKKRLPAEWFDGDEPLFTLNEYFTWQQTFPVGKPVSIHHSYTPSVTTGVPMPASSLIEGYAKETCMDKSMQAAIKRREGAYGVRWANLRYILLTANNWQGPIKDFTLRIKKQSPSDVLSVCFDGELNKVDRSTFEFRQQAYRPNRDLSILFIGNIE